MQIVMCSICNEELNLDIHASMVKVVGWVELKAGKPTGKIVNPSGGLGYAHKVCIETGRNSLSDATLF